MSKIKLLESATIVLSNGATIQITESLDGVFNIDINDTQSNDGIRIGVPNEDGMYYQYWKSIKEKMNNK